MSVALARSVKPRAWAGTSKGESRVLLLEQRLEALQHAPGSHERKLALREAALLEELPQDEGVAGRQGVDGKLLALEVGKRLDLRDGDEAQKAIVAAHEDGEVGPGLRRSFALALHVGHDIVDRRMRDVEAPVDEPGELKDGVRGRRDRHGNPAPLEEALFRGHPDRPVEPAREDDQRKRLGAGLPEGGAETLEADHRKGEGEGEQTGHRVTPV